MPDEAQLETLTAEEIGLSANARIPLRFTPGHTWSPLVISFPHVGLAWPHDLRPKPQVDFARNADYEVQTLYGDVAPLGVATISAVYSRLVVDLNRAPDDVPRELVPDHPAPRPRRKPGEPASDPFHDPREPWDRPGRGVVWASAVSAGAGASIRILEPPLPYRAFASRIERYHAPYYAALSILLERRRRQFGYAVLLDAHSMPHCPLCKRSASNRTRPCFRSSAIIPIAAASSCEGSADQPKGSTRSSSRSADASTWTNRRTACTAPCWARRDEEMAAQTTGTVSSRRSRTVWAKSERIRHHGAALASWQSFCVV
jgi:N-formylglutamate amidohydrolase